MRRLAPVLVLALLLVIGAAAWLLARGRQPPDAPGPATGARRADASNPRVPDGAVAPQRHVTARPAAGGALAADDLASVVPRGEAPAMAEVIGQLNAAGVHSGLAAFPPPGTSPPLVGLAVPEDYALPLGYVRHYQATDDGQRIEPILMFSPDYRFYDAAGREIAIPANRVVPPDLAPPGLVIRRIAIPPALDPGSRPN